MTAQEIYALLDAAGVEYEVVAIFEGSRSINFQVDEETDEEANNVRGEEDES